jgi:hypothetical protein
MKIPLNIISTVLSFYPEKSQEWVVAQIDKAFCNSDLTVLDSAALELILASEFHIVIKESSTDG